VATAAAHAAGQSASAIFLLLGGLEGRPARRTAAREGSCCYVLMRGASRRKTAGGLGAAACRVSLQLRFSPAPASAGPPIARPAPAVERQAAPPSGVARRERERGGAGACVLRRASVPAQSSDLLHSRARAIPGPHQDLAADCSVSTGPWRRQLRPLVRASASLTSSLTPPPQRARGVLTSRMPPPPTPQAFWTLHSTPTAARWFCAQPPACAFTPPRRTRRPAGTTSAAVRARRAGGACRPLRLRPLSRHLTPPLGPLAPSQRSPLPVC
jgi:hypothetical protein